MLALSLILACGGPERPEVSSADCELDLWVPNGAPVPELNVLGVYEPEDGQSVEVTVEREMEMTLVLGSYDAADWVVSAVEGATITEILVTGYHAQSVQGPPGVPVTIRSHDQSESRFGDYCGYAYPADESDCETDAVIAAVEEESGLRLSSFAGCYSSSEFTLK